MIGNKFIETVKDWARLISIADSEIMVPVEVQGRLSQLIQTHNAVSNPAASKSAWIKCIDPATGSYSEITVNSNIAGTIKLEWSNDGATVVSDESFSTTKIARAKVALPWVRVDLTATGTVTTYTLLQA
ncbi:hypothetical protein QUF88_19190 [Bacillus sp. DX1.1]|uniref:hypothetical protein n=1 Tax=unclassified Bacillus (in: firmicutes) TaxID=185979 RepID=UPI0025709823|nr:MULTISPECIES: hypothetical protein [unclassified Bacillus (in: firmicutes)]MDM5155837.1 hypothetical protein [Bacillus sp. DX1.1]WJE80134.1 hypothetical protein QRE67_16720 [Bacillus sp. DX3.1]